MKHISSSCKYSFKFVTVTQTAHCYNGFVTDVPILAPITMKISTFTPIILAPTRDTMIEIVEEEDCSRTVYRIPIMTPATGLVSLSNMAPSAHPPITFTAEFRRLRPRRKTYRKKRTKTIPRKL